MRLDKKYAPYLNGVLMGLSMGLLISFVMKALNVGLGPDFWRAWLVAFGVVAAVGIPTALLAPKAALAQQLTA